MDTTISLAIWLAAALLAAAALGWMAARLKRRHDTRRAHARELLQALQRYSEWVCAQRLAAVFQGESAEAAAALDRACTLRQACFPALAGDMAELLAVHNRLLHFLGLQHALWLRDPEHWLLSDHDARFLALWRQHRRVLQALQERLEQATRVPLPTFTAPRRASTYA